MAETENATVPVISDVQLLKVLQMADVIRVVEYGFREFASNNIVMPQRAIVQISDTEALLSMPVYVGGRSRAIGTKLVTVFEKNSERYDRPTVQAVIVIFDSETGAPRAILDGTAITAYRTGAVSAVATKYLARTNARVVGLIGSGAQARTQLLGVCSVRDIERVKVYSRDRTHLESFISGMRGFVQARLEAVAASSEAVENSDIVITSTNSAKPVISCEWLAEGTHVNAIGSFRPNMREIDEETVRKAKLVVDSRNACLTEAGELAIPISQGKLNPTHIYADLGEIVTGQKPGRTTVEELTVFKSVGLAFEDVVTAKMLLDRLKL